MKNKYTFGSGSQLHPCVDHRGENGNNPSSSVRAKVVFNDIWKCRCNFQICLSVRFQCQCQVLKHWSPLPQEGGNCPQLLLIAMPLFGPVPVGELAYHLLTHLFLIHSNQPIYSRKTSTRLLLLGLIGSLSHCLCHLLFFFLPFF